MQYGNVKRMTAQEHCLRVRFDHTLVEQYVPNNKYKRIFPLDPGRGGCASACWRGDPRRGSRG